MGYGSKGPALPKETAGDKKNYPGSGKKTGGPKLPGERFQAKSKYSGKGPRPA